MSILVFNAGSSSLKFALYDTQAQTALAIGQIDWAAGDRARAKLTLDLVDASTIRREVRVPDDAAAALCAIETLKSHPSPRRPEEHAIEIVGHRVVYGGGEFAAHVRIDERVKEAISRLAELAPLHNPPALEAIRAAETALPQAAQVGVFDTAFYAQMPVRACVYPVPYHWYVDWGIRRIGFHGISHKYCAQRAAEILARDAATLRIVSCHLGGGCSAAAIRGGRPVATTMGFTPMEGLMMGTRSGSIDPGILLHVQRRHGLSVQEIDEALNLHSGLWGLSGVSPDLARVEQAAIAGNARAQLAIDVFTDRIRAAIGALAVGMGGLDVLLFTDRVGERSAGVRSAVCQGLECLGVKLDPQRNQACSPDQDIAAADSGTRILVIHTREELMIAREARQVVTAPGG